MSKSFDYVNQFNAHTNWNNQHSSDERSEIWGIGIHCIAAPAFRFAHAGYRPLRLRAPDATQHKRSAVMRR